MMILQSTIEHHTDCTVPDCVEQVIKRESLRLLKDAMERLTPIQRRRLAAYYFEGKSYRAIAAEEGVYVSIVQRTVEAAVKKLRKNMI